MLQGLSKLKIRHQVDAEGADGWGATGLGHRRLPLGSGERQVDGGEEQGLGQVDDGVGQLRHEPLEVVAQRTVASPDLDHVGGAVLGCPVAQIVDHPQPPQRGDGGLLAHGVLVDDHPIDVGPDFAEHPGRLKNQSPR